MQPLPLTPRVCSLLYCLEYREAIALLESILQFEPSRRCSAIDAMEHPFYATIIQRAPCAAPD